MLRRICCMLTWGTVLLTLAELSPLQAESVLNFPRLSNAAGTLTGVAFINPNSQPAPLTVTAYGSNGQRIQGAGVNNPAMLTVPANAQLALVTSDPQLFGPNLNPNVSGWFQAVSPMDGLTGFFLFLNDSVTVFDGADLPGTSRKIVFNQVRVDGGRSTELNIVNPEDRQTGLDLFLFDGEQIREVDPSDFDLTLPAKGSARLDVATFFQVSQLSEGAYIQVLSETNVGGFELVRGPTGDLLGLNARCLDEGLGSVFFPQLAVLGPWRMEIGLTNYGAVSASLFITAYRPDGTPYGDGVVAQNRVFRNLGPQQSLREDVETLFGFQGDRALDGWIGVESTENSVNGYVTYGVPAVGSIAAVAAPARPLREAVFSHIATDLGFFTGVAALNPASLAADLRIVALTPGGEFLGSFDTVLGPGQRISRLLSEIIPAANRQRGGIIWVSSNRPLYLTSLFGTGSGTVLANIPPQPIPDSYRPDQGMARASLQPSFAVLGLDQQMSFQASGLNSPQWSLSARTGSNGLGAIDSAGNYTAPSQRPGLPVVVTAAQGGLSASATLDVVSAGDFEPGLAGVSTLGYSSTARRLYGARPAQSAGTVDSDLLRISPGSSQLLRNFPNEEISAILPFRDFSGREFLLLTGRTSGLLFRYDPLSDEVRNLVGGFVEPSAMVFDQLNRNLIVADRDGLTEVAGTLLESDRASGLEQNGSLPRFLVATSDIGGVAWDGCSGTVFYTHRTSGEIRSFDPRTGVIETVADGLQSPTSLRALHRREAACGDSLHLLAAEPGTGRVSLVVPGNAVGTLWTDSSAASQIAFLPDENPFFGSEGVLLSDPGVPLQRVALPGLYRERATNPLDAAPTGILSDPVDDLFGSGSAVVDMAEVSALFDATSLELAVTFADPASPARGFVDLDTDLDSRTGLTAVADTNSPYGSKLGVDVYVDLCEFNSLTGACGFDPSSGEADLVHDVDGTLALLGRVPVEYFEYYLVVTIPRTLLGGAGPVRVSAVFGPAERPTDAAPNGGYLAAQEVGSLSAAGRSAVLQAAAAVRSDGRPVSRRPAPASPQPGSWKGRSRP